MKPFWHIIYGAVFSFILVYFFSFPIFAAMIVFVSSILIDLDHLLLYFLETKDLHLVRFLLRMDYLDEEWHKLSKKEKSLHKLPHFILHGIEFSTLLFLLSFINQIFLWILLGIVFHLALDIFDCLHRADPLEGRVSQIWLWNRNKNKKKFNPSV